MATLPTGWDREIKPDTPETQLQNAIANSAIAPKRPVRCILDGKIHRFAIAGDKNTEKAGWYVAFGDNIPAGIFGSWRGSMEEKWRGDTGRIYTPEETAAYEARLVELQAIRDAERRKRYEQIASAVQNIIANAQHASPENAYLARKRVGVYSIYQTGDGRLIVPVIKDGTVVSAQYIEADGSKQYHGGGEVKGGYFPIGPLPPQGPLYIAEGYATAASIYEATGCTTIAALSAGNIMPVAQWLREKLGAVQDITIVGDNDDTNTGQKAAKEAGAAIGARVIIPPDLGDANDYVNAGGDLKLLLTGRAQWLTQADEFCAKPSPVRWLVKKWIQSDGLAMVFGDSGAGKTFVVLDWVLRMAAGIENWAGLRVRPGGVVYLAGEGHHGLKARIAGWKKYYQAEHLNMWISGGACDLNTTEGLAHTVSEIRALEAQDIGVIVVDTLHRFLNGDENKAVDAKTMLDSCAVLQKTFGCSVILVHHTGTAQDAKGRARGSSSWRGALDNQILVTASGDGVKLEQVKQKDSDLAPPIYLQRTPVSLPGWFDEDGQAISTIVLEPDENGDKKEVSKLTKTQHLGIQAYRAAAAESGILNENNEFAGVLENDWREAFYKLYESENRDTKKKAFQRVRNELIDKKDIIITGETYMLATDYELECVQIARELIHNRDILGFCDKNAKSATGQTGQNN